MTPIERVRRARRRLALTVATSAMLWAATLAMTVVALAAIADDLAPLSPTVRLALLALALVAALAAATTVLWRGRAAGSLERVALWIEEREPGLRYALVTAIDARIAPATHHRDLHALANAADVEGVVRHAWHHTLGRALVGCLLAASALAILQPKALLRGAGRELARRAAPTPTAPLANRLVPLAARVTPPAYSRLPDRTVDEPSTVQALIGSRITFGGRGPADGVTAALADQALDAAAREHGWSIGMTMPKNPAVLTLHDRAYKRLVVLEPRTDSAPSVRLDFPEHDTTYQTVPKGKLVVQATLADAIGLASGHFEYMVSKGSGESFDTKMLTGPRVSFDNARSGALRATIELDTMQLTPGTVLYIRAVAFDFNDVTGPGKGISETRTLRIAEPIDSTSINAAPPLPIDSLWMSQRLLNMKTDTLIRTKRGMKRERFVHTSSAYSNAQETLRQKVLSVVSILEDNGVGGSFQTEASTKLREAADLMWTARADLGIAMPDTAMPLMIRILKILDDLRLANRYYLRGLMRPTPVNIARVRMTGKDTGSASARTPRDKLRDAHAALARRIDVVAALARTSPAAAADSLTYIRVAALTSAPAVAGALERAIELLRQGAPADSALARTRRALEPPPRILGGPAEWGGILP